MEQCRTALENTRLGQICLLQRDNCLRHRRNGRSVRHVLLLAHRAFRNELPRRKHDRHQADALAVYGGRIDYYRLRNHYRTLLHNRQRPLQIRKIPSLACDKITGIPTVIIAVVFVWLPYETMSYMQKVIAVFLCYNLLQCFYPFFQQAYTDLANVISPNSHERTISFRSHRSSTPWRRPSRVFSCRCSRRSPAV